MSSIVAGGINNIVTLDVRISCDVFWEYVFKIPVRVDEYYQLNEINNITNNHRHIRDDNRTQVCEIANIGRNDPRFLRLEEYLINYVIENIYYDLKRRRKENDILTLLKKARKFHIHGRTIDDILFPANSTNNHMTSAENIVYICTHC